MPVLSLCLIVRDEEAMLPGLLASVEGLWDELVAADTGSSDRTPDLVRAAGGRVVPHAWRDDFAAARNASLAAATGRWILVLDADERVTPPLAAEIRGLLDDPRAGAATLVMRNELPDGHRRDADLLRLFRNDPSIRYRHRIHEDASDSVQAFLRREGLRLRRLHGVVRHLGYVREVAADRRKKERDAALLRAQVREDPADLYSWYKLLELARFWEDAALAREAAGGAAAALEGADPADLRRRAWSGDLAASAARALHAEPDAALAWLDAHSGHAHPSAGWHLARALLLEELGRPCEAARAFEAALAAARAPDAGVAPQRPLLGLARLAAAAGELDEARRLADEAATAAPRDPEALLAAAGFHRLGGGAGAVAAFAEAHARAVPAARADLARALLAAGEPDLAMDRLAACVDDEPAAALGLLVCSLVTGRPVEMEIALDREAADAALRDWFRVLWRSRRTELMEKAADRLPTVAASFPWLPDFLREETRRLSSSRR